MPADILNPENTQQGLFWQTYSDWDHENGDSNPGTPGDRIWQLFGSRENPSNLVNAESNLNGVKARVWAGQQPMADTTWNENNWQTAGNTPQDARRGLDAISYLNGVSNPV